MNQDSLFLGPWVTSAQALCSGDVTFVGAGRRAGTDLREAPGVTPRTCSGGGNASSAGWSRDPPTSPPSLSSSTDTTAGDGDSTARLFEGRGSRMTHAEAGACRSQWPRGWTRGGHNAGRGGQGQGAAALPLKSPWRNPGSLLSSANIRGGRAGTGGQQSPGCGAVASNGPQTWGRGSGGGSRAPSVSHTPGRGPSSERHAKRCPPTAPPVWGSQRPQTAASALRAPVMRPQWWLLRLDGGSRDLGAWRGGGNRAAPSPRSWPPWGHPAPAAHVPGTAAGRCGVQQRDTASCAPAPGAALSSVRMGPGTDFGTMLLMKPPTAGAPPSAWICVIRG